MTIALNSLGDGYPTFPQFQQMLREYERDYEPATGKPKFNSYVQMQQMMTQRQPQTFVRRQSHYIDQPEMAGQVYQCQRCGKYFDGGSGAVCS